MADKDPGFPRRVACIDIGSNGIRFMAVEAVAPTAWTVLDQARAAVRLGRGAFDDGLLRAEDIEAAVEAVSGFVARAEALDVGAMRAVATSAVRDATNRADLLRRVRRDAGIRIDVIHGAEEARLVHMAVSDKLPLNGSAWMFADLGGGSLEVGLADQDGMHWGESYDLGTVRLLQRFDKEPNAERFQHLIEESVAALRLPGSDDLGRVGGLVATGGNIEALADLAGVGAPGGVAVLTTKALRKQIARLEGLDVPARIEQLDLRPDRADVILPAAYVYLHTAGIAGVKEIHVPNVGLKEGVILDLCGAGGEQGQRREYVVRQGCKALGQRYRSDRAHAEQVSRIALSLFDQTRPLHGLPKRTKPVLLAAALLHDIGTYVAHRSHHKHSKYLIEHAELPGLDRHEVHLTALVARYHRKREPSTRHGPFARLKKRERERVTWLAALLRLADALDADHRQRVDELAVTWDGDRIAVHLAGDGDLSLEAWSLQKKGALFARMAGRDLRIETTERMEVKA